MNFSLGQAGILPAFALLLGLASSAQADDMLLDALTDGTASFELRPRYEVVDQNGKDYSAAATLRALFGYSTKPIDGIGATLEVSDVSAFDGSYNSGLNGKTAYATMLDPRAVGVNQAYLSYTGLNATRVEAGRQIILLDDGRFVGNVDFRQTMQTYDAVSLVNTGLPDLKLFAAYVWGIKNVLNQEVPAQTVLAEASWAPLQAIHLRGFGYWYGNQTPMAQAAIPGAAACGLSGVRACNEETFGATATGSLQLGGGLGSDYEAGYARQKAYDGGSSAIDADYWHLSEKLSWDGFFAAADYMVMGSDKGVYGFQTPLATKHAFNGWAEEFLTTPRQGLDSLYESVGGPILGVDLRATYYRFSSDVGTLQFGHETDFSLSYPLTPHITFALQGAAFHGTTAAYKSSDAGWATLDIKY